MSESVKSPERHQRLVGKLRLACAIAIAAVSLMYCLSGTVIVQPNEVAIVLRFGELIKTTESATIHQPGILLAFPAPIDNVVRIPVRTEQQLTVKMNGPRSADTVSQVENKDSFATDKSAQHLILTGDQQAVALTLTAKFRINDPVAYALHNANPEQIVKSCLRSTVSKTIADWRTEDAMRLPRQDVEGELQMLPAEILERSQPVLNALQTGILLTGVNVVEVKPPASTLAAFEAVQSARIQQQTLVAQATGDRQSEIIHAQTQVSEFLADAKGKLASMTADAHAQTEPFLAALDVADSMGQGQYRTLQLNESWQQILSNAGSVHLITPADEAQLRIRIPAPGSP